MSTIHPIPAPRQLSRWLLLLLLMTICLMVRLHGWMALPIFGDEAIYLRWTQLVKDNWAQHAFVSLVDPKPPLHYWLMAALWQLTGNPSAAPGAPGDPLWAGRLVSISAAVLMIPALFALCSTLQTLYRPEVPRQLMSRREALSSPLPAPSGNILGLLACLLFILCPFLAFYQRMALADGIFAVESIAVGWLSVRLARAARQPAGPITVLRGLWTQALPLGLLMAATMLTRQIISYELWDLPLAAYLLLPAPKPQTTSAPHPGRPASKRFWTWLAAAIVIATLLWSPFLLAQPARYRSAEGTGPVTSKSLTAELRRRILYQPQFTHTGSVQERLTQIEKNFLTVFVPGTWSGDHFHFQPWDKHTTGELDTGWYWVYLTPPVLILGVLAWLWLALRRQWRLLIFLAFWLFLMVGPLILIGSVAYSRYALAGIVPWLLALAFMLADLIAWLFSERGLAAVGWVGAAATALLLGGLLAWPAYDIHLQNDRWQDQHVVRRDKYQYITGWTAGQASQQAVEYLKALPPSPLVIVTGAGWGTPADAIWVYMKDRPQTFLYYFQGDQPDALAPAGETETETLWHNMHQQKYLYDPPTTLGTARGVPVLYICPDPIHTPTADVPGRDMMHKLNPNAQELGNFTNPANGESVIIFRLQ